MAALLYGRGRGIFRGAARGGLALLWATGCAHAPVTSAGEGVPQAQAHVAAPSAAPGSWSYPEGPSWGPACANGPYQQSPIDFTKARTTGRSMPVSVPAMAFVPTLNPDEHNFSFQIPGHPQVMVGGDPYELVEYHFHVIAEHVLAPEARFLEMHVKSHPVADPKKYLVFAVLFSIVNPAPPNDPMAPVLAVLNGQPAGNLDLGAVLKRFETGAFYDYTGSLTTPDCAGGVRFLVLAESQTTFFPNPAMFSAKLQSRFKYPLNERATQPIRSDTRIFLDRSR